MRGKTIVVTGASSGLGKAIADACADAGGNVVCAGRSDATRATAAAIREQGGEAIDVRADVTDEAAVEGVMEEAVERYGSLDVVFCNAGTSDHYKRADETTHEEWEHVINVDLTGVFLCAKHAALRMIPQKRGKIVTIASVWGEIASDTIPVPSYAAAKAGVIGLTKELAIEYLPYGITVNSISPGFFVTSIGADKTTPPGTIDRLIEGALRRTPIHRIMDPDEIKGAAVFLASAAADAVNGHILTVDGGLVAC